MKMKEVMNGMKRTAAVVIVCFLGIIALIPEAVLAGTSNEQVIAGYSLDPGLDLDARQSSIDSLSYNVIAVFSREVTSEGTWNIYASKSTNTGGSWSTPFRICQSENDQSYPDVKLICIDLSTLIVFIVWQEGDGPWTIRTKAVYFSNFGNGWTPYGTGGEYEITSSAGTYQYPRIAGTQINVGSQFYVNVWIAWQSGQDSVIEMISFSEQRVPRWSNREEIVEDENKEFLHPSLDASYLYIDTNGDQVTDEYRSIVVLTYDILDDDTYQVGFMRMVFNEVGSRIVNYDTDLVMDLDAQDDPLYPDITVSGSTWRPDERWSKIYIVAQVIGNESNSIESFANDYGGDDNDWHGPYTAGSMESADPSLRGAAIDDMGSGGWVKVIWAVTDNTYSEIRTHYFAYDDFFNGFAERPGEDPYPVDTYGLYDGALSYVAISVSNGFWHCLYNRASIDVIYYTWKWVSP